MPKTIWFMGTLKGFGRSWTDKAPLVGTMSDNGGCL